MVLVAILVVDVYFLTITYYSEFDMLGPFSKYPLTTLAQFFLPILYILILIKRRETSPIVLLFPTILLIAVKYLGLELAEKYYVVSFYDGWQLFDRGVYVTTLGHSNPQVDAYFDLQSGFFWTTAIVLIVSGVSAFPTNPLLISLTKLFPAIASIVYLPLLILFYRRLLGGGSLTALALTLHFGLAFVNIHYSSQVYALNIYWLTLFLMFVSVNNKDARYTILTLIACFSLSFLHQGIAIFTMLTLISSIIHPLFFRILSRDTRFFYRRFLTTTTVLFASWTAYTIYITIYTFRNFVETLRFVIETWMTEGVKIFSQAFSRTYIAWEQLVRFKGLYILTLMIIGIIISFFNALKSGDEEDKMAFGAQFLLTLSIGPVAMALGGAGYVERLPTALFPLIVYSIIKFFAKINMHRFARLCLVVSCVVLILLSSIFYFSGRNFQSISMGVHYSRIFFVNKDPRSIDGIYTGSKTVSIKDAVVSYLSSASIPTSEFIKVESHVILETFYYVCANMSTIEEVIRNLSYTMVKIYDNGDAAILRVPK